MKNAMRQFTDLMLRHESILEMVDAENNRQLEKWGIQTHSLFEWVVYTMEELGELAESISEYTYRNGSKTHIVKESIQVATLALKIAEMVEHSE